MRDFGISRYCDECGLEKIEEGEYITMSENSKFCECNKENNISLVEEKQ